MLKNWGGDRERFRPRGAYSGLLVEPEGWKVFGERFVNSNKIPWSLKFLCESLGKRPPPGQRLML